MGRRTHLQQTLRPTIEQLGSNAEIVLLDYNSPDGLKEWIAEEFSAEIACESLLYYRTSEPAYFHHSHARNVLALLAKGPIVCVLDADNFLEPGFSDWLLENMGDEPGKQVGVCQTGEATHGRIAIFRDDFIRLGGYDERMIGWGFEDNDFRRRALRLGLNPIELPRELMTRFVEHDDAMRTACLPAALNNRWATHRLNHRLSLENVAANSAAVNNGKVWGKATVSDFAGNIRKVGYPPGS